MTKMCATTISRKILEICGRIRSCFGGNLSAVVREGDKVGDRRQISVPTEEIFMLRVEITCRHNQHYGKWTMDASVTSDLEAEKPSIGNSHWA